MFSIKKYVFFSTVFILLFVAGVISTNKESYSLRTLENQDQKIEFFTPVIQKLIDKGIPYDFVIELIKDTSVNFNERYVQVDVSLKKSSKPTTPSHSNIYQKLVNDDAVDKIVKFIQSNKTILDAVKDKYNVHPEILASLLWVETRHGEYLGNHQVVSVYLSLALADQDDFVEFNLKRNKDKLHPTKKDLVELKSKVIQRSKAKANWALNELVSIYKNKDKFPTPITQIYGSWAGAFGISQFIPSSFARWAKDGNNDGYYNLFDLDDAIHSAAHYLRNHGYGDTEKQKRKAIYSYNHSNTYVNTIILLAKRALEKIDKLEKIDTEQILPPLPLIGE